MKKVILALAFTALSFGALAAGNENNNTVPVNVTGDVGALHVSQCASVFGNCNNASLDVNLNGNVQTVYVDGKATVVKGKDGVNGKDGATGATGATGAAGERGEKGDAGEDGAAGRDGADGKDGQDADMTLVNANTQAIATETEERKAGDISAQLRIDQANANIEANRQASINTNKRVSENTAAIASHEQRITSLEQQTSKGFSDLKRQIDDNKKDANAGIAGVAAMANIPQVTANQTFSVGAGVGARGSEQAVAVGFSGRVTENVVTKVAVSADTQSGWTVGAGVSYGW